MVICCGGAAARGAGTPGAPRGAGIPGAPRAPGPRAGQRPSQATAALSKISLAAGSEPVRSNPQRGLGKLLAPTGLFHLSRVF